MDNKVENPVPLVFTVSKRRKPSYKSLWLAEYSSCPEIFIIHRRVMRPDYLNIYLRHPDTWDDDRLESENEEELIFEDPITATTLFKWLKIPRRLKEVFEFRNKGYTGEYTESGQQYMANILGKQVEFTQRSRDSYSFELLLASTKIYYPQSIIE